jgi:hypothetical protein
MHLSTIVVLMLSMLVCTGCGRYIYIRDNNSLPVSGATLSMTSDRIDGEQIFDDSNVEGKSHLSIQVPGVKTIIARKAGYKDARTNLVNDTHIVLVLIPEK